MNTKPLIDLADRVGWTFVQALAGSIVAGGTAVSLHSFDWRAALAGGGSAAVICLFKVLGVRFAALASIEQAIVPDVPEPVEPPAPVVAPVAPVEPPAPVVAPVAPPAPVVAPPVVPPAVSLTIGETTREMPVVRADRSAAEIAALSAAAANRR